MENRVQMMTKDTQTFMMIEVVTKNQYTGNDHYARKTVDNIQPYDHGKLVEELLQPDRQLVSDIKADTDVICTIDELAQA